MTRLDPLRRHHANMLDTFGVLDPFLNEPGEGVDAVFAAPAWFGLSTAEQHALSWVVASGHKEAPFHSNTLALVSVVRRGWVVRLDTGFALTPAGEEVYAGKPPPLV